MDTNATIKRITNQIANLPSYMQMIKSDVPKFNLHVEDLTAQLSARGVESNELLINLFKAYKTCQDDVFTRYIEAKENSYDEGLELSAEDLMQIAKAKYQSRVDNGEWQAPSPEQEKIVTLEAKLKKMQDQKKSKPSKKEESKSKKKSKKDSNKKEKPAWMTKPPTDREKKNGNSKKVDGKQYWYCETHKAWVRHKPEECKGLGYMPNLEKSGGKTKKDDDSPTLQQKTSVIDTIEEESDESDDE